MGKSFLKRIFGRRSSQAIAVQPALPKRRFHQADYRRFIGEQLGYQSVYFPQLTEIHNRMLRKPEFHGKGKVPVITGDREIDALVTRNMQQMCRLKYQINELRLRATKIKDPKTSLEDAKKLWDASRMCEVQFENLKDQTSKIFLEFFMVKKKPAQ